MLPIRICSGSQRTRHIARHASAHGLRNSNRYPEKERTYDSVACLHQPSPPYKGRCDVHMGKTEPFVNRDIMNEGKVRAIRGALSRLGYLHTLF